ncbi:hypothetical protein M5D96_013626 [Drosophila gunungcola]|uniref:Uncharacterized protein n=1 Tax=Drosophila gunungcola TaxID=103775 RepID=A0A9Q0BJE4_9MUSC|nr:hypothetical protein M5D96_013626 [Drosophila gunungcola]
MPIKHKNSGAQKVKSYNSYNSYIFLNTQNANEELNFTKRLKRCRMHRSAI